MSAQSWLNGEDVSVESADLFESFGFIEIDSLAENRQTESWRNRFQTEIVDSLLQLADGRVDGVVVHEMAKASCKISKENSGGNYLISLWSCHYPPPPTVARPTSYRPHLRYSTQHTSSPIPLLSVSVFHPPLTNGASAWNTRPMAFRKGTQKPSPRGLLRHRLSSESLLILMIQSDLFSIPFPVAVGYGMIDRFH